MACKRREEEIFTKRQTSNPADFKRQNKNIEKLLNQRPGIGGVAALPKRRMER